MTACILLHSHHTPHTHTAHTHHAQNLRTHTHSLPLQLARLTTPVGRCGCCLLLRGAGHPPGPPHASHNPRTIYNNHPHPLCGARSELRLGTCSCSRSEGDLCLKLFYTHHTHLIYFIRVSVYKKAAAPVQPRVALEQRKAQHVRTSQWHTLQLIACMRMSKGAS